MSLRRIAKPCFAIAFTSYYIREKKMVYASSSQPKLGDYSKFRFPKRNELIGRLQSENFDLLVIGGGATGAGIAYDAASRGLKVALVERNDFSSGTSSKSTKLIHGGVRYLQAAVLNLDYSEFKLVTEALHERKLLLKECPNLASPVPILLPCSGFFDFIYKASGLALYEMISFDRSMVPKYVSKHKIEEMFPYINTEKIYNGILYFDGQFNDSRMNLTVLQTAIYHGCVALNYTNAVDFIRNDGIIDKVILHDKIADKNVVCRAKYIVNATGPYTDLIREKTMKDYKPICHPSSGVHLSMPKDLTESGTGILLNDDNNRVLFVLPWEGTTIVGTSDQTSQVVERPIPSSSEIDFVLNRFSSILKSEVKVGMDDVKSIWCGIRPLVSDPKSNGDTSKLSRHHIIEVSNNVMNVMGGKWTIFRKMGQDSVDLLLKMMNKTNSPQEFALIGCDGWTPEFTNYLMREYQLEQKIAEYLSHTYGLLAENIVKKSNGRMKILIPDHPYTEEEIEYVCENEYVHSLEDIVSRRLRLSFIDAVATNQALTKVADISSRILRWTPSKKKFEIEKCQIFLFEEMGLNRIKTENIKR